MIVEVIAHEEWQDFFEKQMDEFGEVIVQRDLQPGVPEFKGRAAFQKLFPDDFDDSLLK
jgi:SPX domain protein involved in polyphosphate accumulation